MVKARLEINGNVIEIDPPAEILLNLITGTTPSEDPSPKSDRKPRISYARIYNDALGMSIKEYISANPACTSDQYFQDINAKIAATGTTISPNKLKTAILAALSPR